MVGQGSDGVVVSVGNIGDMGRETSWDCKLKFQGMGADRPHWRVERRAGEYTETDVEVT